MRPKVSVVMPTYNRARVIQNAIRSVIDQTYKDWELIIVDDGSDDHTERIVKNFAYPKIVYHKAEHSGYVSKVRNIGNKLAKGDIIVVHDSDDVAFPDRLEEIVKCFEQHPYAEAVYHGMYLKFYDVYHDSIVRGIRPVRPYSKDHLLSEQYIPGQIAYKRHIIMRHPYDERIRCCDDYQMLLEFALNDVKFQPLYKNLYEYTDSPDSINVHGEAAGWRRQDMKVICKDILRGKYGIEARAEMFKNTVDKNITSVDDL